MSEEGNQYFNDDSNDPDDVEEVMDLNYGDKVKTEFLNSFVNCDGLYIFVFERMNIVYKPNEDGNKLIPNHITLYYNIDNNAKMTKNFKTLDVYVEQEKIPSNNTFFYTYSSTVKIIFPITDGGSIVIKMINQDITSSFKNKPNGFCIPPKYFSNGKLNMKTFNTVKPEFNAIENKKQYTTTDEDYDFDSLVLEFYPHVNTLYLTKKKYKTKNKKITSYYMFIKQKSSYFSKKNTSSSAYAINNQEVKEDEFKKLPNWIPQDLLDEEGNLKIQPLSISSYVLTGGSNKRKNNTCTQKRAKKLKKSLKVCTNRNRKGCKHGILFRP